MKLTSGLSLLLLIATIPARALAGLDSASSAPPRGGSNSGYLLQKLPDGLSLRLDSLIVRLKVCDARTVQVMVSRPDAPAWHESLVVLRRWAKVPWRLEQGRDEVTLRTDRLSASVDPRTGSITFRDSAGSLLVREDSAAPHEITPATVAGEQTFHVLERLRPSPDEAHYGLGQFEVGTMNYRGHEIVLVQNNRHIVVPFLVSSRLYGIYWDNYSDTRFHDVGVVRSPYSEAIGGGLLAGFASCNFRMNEFTGAVLKAQLQKLETICSRLRANARKVREAICPGTSMEEFTVRMGLDAILTAPDIKKEKIGENRFRNEWGVVLETTAEEHGFPVEGPIRTLDDFRRYSPPDPLAPGRYESLKRLVKRYKGKLAVGVHLNDVFSIPRYLAGFENLLMGLVEEPELVRGLVDLSVETNLVMAKECARCGADFVFTGDDYASAERPFMSPRAFREFFEPGLKRVIAGFHEAGLPVIKHTDGQILPLVDMIVDSGIDCLDPIDPVAGMDIAAVKAKYGGRVALKGNVDCASTMTFGSVKDVIEARGDRLDLAQECSMQFR